MYVAPECIDEKRQCIDEASERKTATPSEVPETFAFTPKVHVCKREILFAKKKPFQFVVKLRIASFW